MSDNIHHLLTRIWRYFSRRRKLQFAFLVVLMVLTAFSEVFSLGTLLPFLAVLTDPARLFANPSMQVVLRALDITSPQGMVLVVTLAFVVAVAFLGVMRLVQAWANMRVSYAAGADISIAVYRRALYQPYSAHVARNSSALINAVYSKSFGVISGGIAPVISMITAAMVLISIIVVLVMIEPVIALSAFGGFGLSYIIIASVTGKQLKENGALISRESDFVIKSLQEGFGGIRDVLIDGNQRVYSDIYSKAIYPLLRANGNNMFIGQSPRFGVESIGMILIAFLAYWLVGQEGGFARAVPVLGTLALGAQRMFPSLQQLYVGWTTLQGSGAVLKDVLELLDMQLPEQSLDGNKMLSFQKSIKLCNLGFRYHPDSPEVLHDVNLEIGKGSRVGFIGATGSGKSTLLDVVMGLLEPTHGTLQVDDVAIVPKTCRSWQAHLAHVPQAIFLADISIEENIAFGVPKKDIDHDRVRAAARQAQISDIIESLPKQYKTFVGERGIRLSGGQRQRIGIARALYKQADVIIFDEATSALDNQTEAAVMQSVEELHEDLTVLIIAHRLTTLKKCDTIVELEHGKIKRLGSYEEIISSPHSAGRLSSASNSIHSVSAIS